MVPLVSDRYKYILFYNPKSACSVARQLFLRLHKDELSDIQRAELDSLKEANQDEWHNVNTMFPLRINNKAGVEEFEKYSDYYKFTLVRHPITRFISAYLNRIVLQQTDLDKIRRFLLERYGKGHNVDYSFKQFLQFFDQSNTDNAHFLPQSNMKGGLSGYSLISPFREKTNELDLLGGLKRRLLKASAPKVLKLDEVCKVETLQSDFLRVYKKVFAGHEDKLEVAVEAIKSLPFHNVTLSSDEVISDAASLSAEELRQMERMPAYENFVNPQVEKIWVLMGLILRLALCRIGFIMANMRIESINLGLIDVILRRLA